MSLAYPVGGVFDNMHAKRARKNFAATPTFIDHTHQYNGAMPVSRCAL